MALGNAVADLRRFHDVPPPAGPPEYRLAAWLVKGLTYAALAFPVALPGVVLLMVASDRLTMGQATGNPVLLLVILAAIPTFVILARAYPSFVAGERWSQVAISLVGFGILALMPVRFLREAATKAGPALPPTRAEWIVFFAAAAFLYFVLCQETRAGMRDLRLAAERRVTPPAREEPLVAAPAEPPMGVKYACPGCGRVYTMKKQPPAGTLCPRCRAG